MVLACHTGRGSSYVMSGSHKIIEFVKVEQTKGDGGHYEPDSGAQQKTRE